MALAQPKKILIVALSATSTINGGPGGNPPDGSYAQITGDVGVRLGMLPYWTVANSPLGVFTIYASNDFDPSGPTGNWTDVTAKFAAARNPDGTSNAAAAGFAAGDFFDYAWICVIYTRTSGGAGDVAKFPLCWRG